MVEYLLQHDTWGFFNNGLLYLPNSFANSIYNLMPFFAKMRNTISCSFIDSESGNMIDIRHQNNQANPFSGFIDPKFEREKIERFKVAPFFLMMIENMFKSESHKQTIKTSGQGFFTRGAPRSVKNTMKRIERKIDNMITPDLNAKDHFSLLLATSKIYPEKIYFFTQALSWHLIRQSNTAFPIPDILTRPFFKDVWIAWAKQHQEALSKNLDFRNYVTGYWGGEAKMHPQIRKTLSNSDYLSAGKITKVRNSDTSQKTTETITSTRVKATLATIPDENPQLTEWKNLKAKLTSEQKNAVHIAKELNLLEIHNDSIEKARLMTIGADNIHTQYNNALFNFLDDHQYSALLVRTLFYLPATSSQFDDIEIAKIKIFLSDLFPAISIGHIRKKNNEFVLLGNATKSIIKKGKTEFINRVIEQAFLTISFQLNLKENFKSDITVGKNDDIPESIFLNIDTPNYLFAIGIAPVKKQKTHVTKHKTESRVIDAMSMVIIRESTNIMLWYALMKNYLETTTSHELIKTKSLDGLSEILFREQVCAIPAKDRLKKIDALTPIWKMWCEKEEAKAKAEERIPYLRILGSETRKAFIDFWGGKNEIPKPLGQFLKPMKPKKTGTIKKIHNRTTLKKATPPLTTKNNHYIPSPVFDSTKPEEINFFSEPIIVQNFETGEFTFNVQNWPKSNVNLWIKIEMKGSKAKSTEWISFNRSEQTKLPRTFEEKMNYVTFCFSKIVPCNDRITRSSSNITFYHRIQKTKSVNSPSTVINATEKSSLNSTVDSENNPQIETEELLGAALLDYEKKWTDAANWEDKKIILSSTILDEADIPLKSPFREQIQKKGSDYLAGSLVIQSKDLKEILTKIFRAHDDKSKKETQKTDNEMIIDNWKLNAPETFHRLARGMRILKRYQGNWKQKFNGCEDYWWNLVWKRVSGQKLQDDINRLRSDLQKGGINFWINPTSNGKKITSNKPGIGKRISKIRFSINIPKSQDRIIGNISIENENPIVDLENADKTPFYWKNEAQNVGQSIFATVAEISTSYGQFEPMNTRKIDQKKRQYHRIAFEHINNKNGRIISYDNTGIITNIQKGTASLFNLIDTKNNQLRTDVELLIHDAKIQFLESIVVPKNPNTIRHIRGRKNQEEIIGDIYTELRFELTDRNKKYIILRGINTIAKHRKLKTPTEHAVFSGKAKHIFLQTLQNYKIDPIDLLSDDGKSCPRFKPTDIISKRLDKDPKTGEKNICFVKYLINRWEEWREEVPQENKKSPKKYKRIIPVFQAHATIDFHEALEEASDITIQPLASRSVFHFDFMRCLR